MKGTKPRRFFSSSIISDLSRFLRGGKHVTLRKTPVAEFVNLAVRDGLLVDELIDELGCLGIAEVGRNGHGDVVVSEKALDELHLTVGRGTLPTNPGDDFGRLLLRSHGVDGESPLSARYVSCAGVGLSLYCAMRRLTSSLEVQASIRSEGQPMLMR